MSSAGRPPVDQYLNETGKGAPTNLYFLFFLSLTNHLYTILEDVLRKSFLKMDNRENYKF